MNPPFYCWRVGVFNHQTWGWKQQASKHYSATAIRNLTWLDPNETVGIYLTGPDSLIFHANIYLWNDLLTTPLTSSTSHPTTSPWPASSEKRSKGPAFRQLTPTSAFLSRYSKSWPLGLWGTKGSTRLIMLRTHPTLVDSFEPIPGGGLANNGC